MEYSWFEFRVFHSPNWLLYLGSRVYPPIYPHLSQGFLHQVKRKEPHQRFELTQLVPFSIMLTVMPHIPPMLHISFRQFKTIISNTTSLNQNKQDGIYYFSEPFCLLNGHSMWKDLILVVDWLVVQVLWHINLCRLFNTLSIFIQMISSISNKSVQHE